LIPTLLIFPKFEFAQTGVGIEALIKLFCAVFGFGFAWNSLVNEGVKWGRNANMRDINISSH